MHSRIKVCRWLSSSAKFQDQLQIMCIICYDADKIVITNYREENMVFPLRWRHNDHYSVSNQQPHGCLLNRLFRRRWKKTSKLRVTGLCVGNSPGPVNSPHKGPFTRKMFPFDDVFMAASVSKFCGTLLFRGNLPVNIRFRTKSL